ncbi:MAG: hypothetical protein HY928_02805 [Elusimicrobia bacterium]|nr:hypothetical protein [Elusimicrobiota bacterium]
MGKTIFPSWRDPRWTGILFLGSYTVYALLSPGFSRRPEQVATGLAVCLLLDAFLARALWKVPLFPLSAVFPAFGMALMCDTPLVWPYAAIGVLAIGSKHFLRSGPRHIFNPLNFAIVVMLLFASPWMAIGDDRWGGYRAGAAVVAGLGLLSTFRSRRLDLSLTYVASFLAGAAVLSFVQDRRFLSLAAPATGAIFCLFTFSMVPDPATTPDGRARRIAFGVAVGGVETLLRAFEVRNSPFYALFVVNALYSALPPEERPAVHRGWAYPDSRDPAGGAILR